MKISMDSKSPRNTVLLTQAKFKKRSRKAQDKDLLYGIVSSLFPDDMPEIVIVRHNL
jgi:hypothetical protein